MCIIKHKENSINFEMVEKEIVILLAVKRLIGEIVNHETIILSGEGNSYSISFPSMTHQKYFNLMLVDLLSETDENIVGEKTRYMFLLHKIGDNPSFNVCNSVRHLTGATEVFREWLNKDINIEGVWFPSINLQVDLIIKRYEFIKICGNISKHNFTRLSFVANDIKTIFKRNGYDLTIENSIQILEEFYEWFHVHILTYHSSAIAEFLNNLSWGIHDYLRPEFEESISYISGDPDRKYLFRYPNGVNNILAKNCYWDLMNICRSEPYIKRFEVTKYLKMRY